MIAVLKDGVQSIFYDEGVKPDTEFAHHQGNRQPEIQDCLTPG
jgi:hypothetical protein